MESQSFAKLHNLKIGFLNFWSDRMYKKSKLFLFFGFIVIPSIIIPINRYIPDTSYITYILFVIMVLLVCKNQRYVRSTLKDPNKSSSDYKNVLNILDKMLLVQYTSIAIFTVCLFGLILISNINSEVDRITIEVVRTVLLSLLIPSILVLVVSTLHILIQPSGQKFDLWLSRAWILTVDSKNKDSEKITALKNCIENYDDFLFRLLKQRINHIEKLFEKIALDSSTNIDNLIQEIKEKYTDEDLSIARRLKDYLLIDDKTIFLSKPPIHIKLSINAEIVKNIVFIIATVMSFLIAIMTEFSFLIDKNTP